MNKAIATVGVSLSIIGAVWLLGFSGLIFDRAARPIVEETRRLVYQESTTAQTACHANLSRLYREWATAQGHHRTALEAMARSESARYRCRDLDPAVQSWVDTINR